MSKLKQNPRSSLPNLIWFAPLFILGLILWGCGQGGGAADNSSNSEEAKVGNALPAAGGVTASKAQGYCLDGGMEDDEDSEEEGEENDDYEDGDEVEDAEEEEECGEEYPQPEMSAEDDPALGLVKFADVEPALSKHCIACHNNTRADGGYNLEGFDNAKVNVEEIIESIEEGEMPPRGMPQVSQAELNLFAAWQKGGLSQ